MAERHGPPGWTGQHLWHVAEIFRQGRNPAARVYESIAAGGDPKTVTVGEVVHFRPAPARARPGIPLRLPAAVSLRSGSHQHAMSVS